MSTLKADTIQSTSGGAATLTKQQAAKSWVNFSSVGDSLAARDSFNVSGLVDEETGITTVSFTNNMQSDANYATMMGGHDIAGSKDLNSQHIFVNRFTSSNYVVQTNNSNSVAANWELNNAANFGDLA